MKYCTKCGKELFDEAVICVGCGCPVSYSTTQFMSPAPPREYPNIANMAMLFAFLIPVLGLIFGIIGSCKYKTPEYHQKSKIAIVVSIVVWSFCIILCGVIIGLCY